VSPKEVKRENNKLVYEKPVLIGLGDTLPLGAGGCTSGSYDSGQCRSGHSAASHCNIGYSPGGNCVAGTWKA